MAAATKPKQVWQGDPALKRLLVPVTDLHTAEGNPRRGDLDAIAASLRRFGQYRPLVVGADGHIIGGNHTYLAAIGQLGWTHIAAIRTGLAGDEARAALLADNRTHDLGPGYDSEALVEHLRLLAELDALEGTGYSLGDLDDELARLRGQLDQPAVVPGVPLPPTNTREVVLIYSPEQHAQLEAWLTIVGKETGADGVSERVYRAVEVAARQLNQA